MKVNFIYVLLLVGCVSQTFAQDEIVVEEVPAESSASIEGETATEASVEAPVVDSLEPEIVEETSSQDSLAERSYIESEVTDATTDSSVTEAADESTAAPEKILTESLPAVVEEPSLEPSEDLPVELSVLEK